MPKLASYAAEIADLSERFLIVGVHQKGPASLDAVHREAQRGFAARDDAVKRRLLPVVVLDADVGGLFHTYDQGLGGMVLLDPRGTVVAVGEAALTAIQADVRGLRDRISGLVGGLEQARDGREASAAIAKLLDIGLGAADGVARQYAARCPIPVASYVLATMAGRGHADLVLESMAHSDPKRRRAAFEAMAGAPAPLFTEPLLALTTRKGVAADERCLALRAACALTPVPPEVETRVTELSLKADPPVRTCAIGLIGKLGSPSAKQHLLDLLAKDEWRGARMAAATALVNVEGDDVVEALRRASTDDKIDTVRTAAKQALAARAKRSAQR